MARFFGLWSLLFFLCLAPWGHSEDTTQPTPDPGAPKEGNSSTSNTPTNIPAVSEKGVPKEGNSSTSNTPTNIPAVSEKGTEEHTTTLLASTQPQQHNITTEIASAGTEEHTTTLLASTQPQQHNITTEITSAEEHTTTLLASTQPQQHNITTEITSAEEHTTTLLASTQPQQHNITTEITSAEEHTTTLLASTQPQQHNITTEITSAEEHTTTLLASTQPQQHNITTEITSAEEHTTTLLASTQPQQHNITTEITSAGTEEHTTTLLASTQPQQHNITTEITSAGVSNLTSPANTIAPLTSTQSSSTSPANTTAPLTSTQSSSTSPANTTAPLTSTQSSSTSPPLTTDNSTSQVTCQYNLTNGENDPVVKITGSANRTYTVMLVGDQRETLLDTYVSSSFTIPFKMLKPCTNYTIRVDGCISSGDTTIFYNVSESKKHSVSVTSAGDEICVTDEKWNLSKCEIVTPENSCKWKAVDFVLEKCTYTINVTMPPVKPDITFTEDIPSRFNWTNKLEECDNGLKVKCTNNSDTNIYSINESVSLLPLMKYDCAGEFSYQNEIIKSKNIPIYIDCEWGKNTVMINSTNTSISMSWKQNDKCREFKLHDFKAQCLGKNSPEEVKCTTYNTTYGVECTINKLHPYTDYNCEMKATSDKTYNISNFNQKTKASNPDFKEIKVTYHHNKNYFTATCNESGDWNGKEGTFQAELINNKKIEISTKYQKKCHFTFSDLYYLTTYKIKITATNGNGLEQHIETEATTDYNDKAVIGFLVFLIIVTSIALLFVLFKIVLLKRKRREEEENIPLTQPLLSVEPIGADSLVDTYKKKIADEGRLFLAEFQSIPRIFNNYTIKEAKKTENQYKNRYVDILPYDYNRVTLSTGGEGDYINASFIEGYKEPKKYIAAQGPKDETIDDFWRMIWEQKSSIIVMVTRCEEGNKSKCAQYWPSLDRETEIFEDFVVKIRSEDHCPDYIIRHLVVTNKREKATDREVTHIQFISWPDHGVPGEPSLLLKLRRRVNSFKNFFSGPIVIHCSAGVGRTGTYIGIDAMIESLEAEGKVDIYGYVAKLRRQRCLMVQVEAQYILIHTALIEHNQFGETEMSLSEFHSELNTFRHKDGNDLSLLEMEFQKLPKFKNWRTFNTAISEENKTKNRCLSVVPYDFNRVLFRLDMECNQTSDPEDEEEYSSDEEEEESNEYINASFLDGYWCNKSLIAAQGPLPNTTAEFLLMLYQQQTKTLVMLTDCKEDDKDYCSQYWGDEKKVFGEMEIEVKRTESFPTYVRRCLEIQSTKKNEILKLDQYQFLKWRNSELPENPQELIEMIRNIRENGGYDKSKMNRNIPVVVHCNNGSSRTGIFCALWNLMDSASTEKLVDVFQEVKNLRRERQGMIETIEQYQFLYTALEGAFPVQNGGMKTPAANDGVQIINETTALLSEPASSTCVDQKEEETSQDKESSAQEDTAAVTENTTASTSPADEASENSNVSEKASTEGAKNGPSVTVDV
ncbi:receptor-type tyrosine-protein phosphatase C-like isoform X6 [Xyrauchen texanus]|uniref:receptor-type tyrosine-protein phosphatase C-like isoform X6 n=1 Tax=Xyrauchen texanus TaxID=154827 RepID=UPI002241D96C|nr:receptor-type tyrosine-protein phosphatase C-like isoform X6 [Xyrauchen texanus]